MDLTGRRIVVTGSSRGLGFAFAQGLVQRGASVVINGTDPERLEIAARELGVPAVCGPVHDEAIADALVAAAVDAFGGVDLVVNNAGVVRDRTLLKMTGEEFDAVIAVHLRGTWAVSRAAARAMTGNGGGSILNVVSGSALFGLVGQSNYAAAKGGILAFTRALSVELAGKGIRVNALYPVALTDMTRPLGGTREFGPPEAVAPIVAFLAADTTLTGQLIHFDGRDLVLWTHPAPAASASGEWTEDSIAAFFAEHPPEPLHPDRWAGRDA